MKRLIMVPVVFAMMVITTVDAILPVKKAEKTVSKKFVDRGPRVARVTETVLSKPIKKDASLGKPKNNDSKKDKEKGLETRIAKDKKELNLAETKMKYAQKNERQAERNEASVKKSLKKDEKALAELERADKKPASVNPVKKDAAKGKTSHPRY